MRNGVNGRHHRKMTREDVLSVVNELQRWANGERATDLTWMIVERFSGYSKPALWAKPEIKNAFQQAKTALRDPNRKLHSRTKEEYVIWVEESRDDALKKLDEYKQLEQKWLARWQRIAFHLQQIGKTIEEFDKPLLDVNRS